MTKRIAIALWNGTEELDFAGPWEVLSAWTQRAPEDGYEVVTVAESLDPVTCAKGLRVLPHTTWSEVGKIDVLVLPGGNTAPLREDEGFVARMRELAAGGTLMTSVCTGSLVFQLAGLLDGRPATTHWGALDILREAGVDVREDERYVDTGDVITAQGVSAGIDMALHIVVRLAGAERARDVRRYIQYDPDPPV